jgi:hypothetical protein
MSTPVGHDLSGIIKWTDREDWQPHLDAVRAEHFLPAAQFLGLTFEALVDAVGPDITTVQYCAFEDFLTRRFGPDAVNPIEDYLRRRGWKERIATRAYLTQLQGSIMSIYEVSDVVPGKSFRARDLIRGGALVEINERSATQMLKPWDRIAARVVTLADRNVVGGGVLAFSLAATDRLLDALPRHKTRRPGGAKSRKGEGAPAAWLGSDEKLRAAAPLFTTTWMLDVLPSVLDPTPPVLVNTDGDAIVFHTVRFPLAAGAPARDVEVRLNGLATLREDGDGFWGWIKPADTGSQAPGGRKRAPRKAVHDDNSVILGHIELKNRAVLLSVNSAGRAEQGRVMLADTLAGLVRPPLTEIQTTEQVHASTQHSGPAPADSGLSLKEQTELVHVMLDRQYLATLDEKVPMLGNRTPRAAARSAGGQRDVAVWLKFLENANSRIPEPGSPMATYDFGWLWFELGVEHLRK